MSQPSKQERVLESYVEYLESQGKRLWGWDIVVIVTLLAFSLLAWSYWNEIVSLGLLGSAFYYCGHGDGKRMAAKRGINMLAFGAEDPWDPEN